MFNFTKKQPESKKSCSLSKDVKKKIMKDFKEDAKKMSEQERRNREAACYTTFGMSSEKFMKTMLK